MTATNIVLKWLVLLSLSVSPITLWAHTSPTHSEPGAGATVQSVPFDVRITFNTKLEPVFSTLMVKNNQDDVISEGSGTVDPDNANLLSTHVESAPAGTYHVFWVALSRDGHRTQGDYTFTVK